MIDKKNMRIGITGQSGFMGSHLYNYLGLKKDVERISFADDYFKDRTNLDEFIQQCDVIVHLAAMNRHGDPQVIYDTNIKLVKELIDSCERTSSQPHILFSSSTQEELDNLYGKSKREGRLLLEEWSQKNKSSFTALIIPNVFGPFGNPFYNSVIATFCYQLSHGEEPKIQIDGLLKLIYINELVEVIWGKIIESKSNIKRVEKFEVPFTNEIKVSEILSLLKMYKELYFEKGIIPAFKNKFEINLFNTFRCYFPNEKFPFLLKENIDDRGSFVEIVRANTSGQYSYSTTKPGFTRGNHYHTRKMERFAVIAGKAEIAIRRIGTADKIEYELNGNNPSYVDIPIWHTHNIINTGNEDLITLFWINEPYDPNDPDTYYEKV